MRKSAVTDPQSTDANVRGVRRFNELVAADPRLSATALHRTGGDQRLQWRYHGSEQTTR